MFMPRIATSKPKRSHIEIIVELLDIASGRRVTKTVLMNRTNVKFPLADSYLEFMERKGMIERADATTEAIYSTTRNGAEALSSLRNALDAIKELPA